MTNRDLITTALASIGFTFAMQTNAHGHPYAAFNMATRSGASFPTTVSAQGGWLVLSALRVLPGPALDNDLKMFAAVNVDWRFGRIYFNAEDDHYQVSIALDAGSGPPPGEAMRAAIDHLADAAQLLRGFGEPRFEAPVSPASLGDVKAVLDRLGIAAVGHEAEDAVGWGVVEPTGAQYSIQVQLFANLLVVRGIRDRVTVDRAGLDAVQRLDKLLAAGTVQLAPWSGDLYYELVVPLAWYPLQPERMQRYLDEARTAMVVVEQAFPKH
jgi:hypothetical protein